MLDQAKVVVTAQHNEVVAMDSDNFSACSIQGIMKHGSRPCQR
jgi:hypothetical protein